MTETPRGDLPLAGARIAVLIESEFIPGELEIYRRRFGAYGAEVDLVSRLWGQPSLRFYSTCQPTDDAVPPVEWAEATLDVDTVDLAAYDAVVAMANYTSVRLRYVDPPPATSAREGVRASPAARFFRRAMADRRIVKAAPCHALWLLTPSPDVLAGRRVTCNPVVLADVLNAGGLYVPPPPGTPAEEHVVVDDDLVTSTSWHATEKLVDAVRDGIVERRAGRHAVRAEHPAAARMPLLTPSVSAAPRERRVLALLSEWGYWGEELVGPLGELDRAGFCVEFCTPTGKRPNAIPVSLDPEFFDPPLGRTVTSAETAERARRFDDPTTAEGARLEHPIDLSAWFPERPYPAAPNAVRLLEVYNRDLERAAGRVADYEALLIVGGSGPIVDLANNQRVHDLVLAFYRAGRPIVAECYGVACLAFARDANDRRSILAGKHVTGHCLEYDYKDGTSFVSERGRFLDFNMGPPPYPLEYILRDATAPNGAYIGNFGRSTSVVVDYPFITARSTPDSALAGQKLVEVLDAGLRRWGW